MTEQQLNECSIYTLREVARSVGVDSPTSKKKAQLILEILEITQGKKAPKVKTKQGRPPKSFGYSFGGVFTPGSLQSTQIIFRQEDSGPSEEAEVVTGYVECVNANTTYLWVKTDLVYNCYFIPAQIVAKCFLKTGDLVSCQLGTGEEKMIVNAVLSVNNVPIVKYDAKRKDFEKLAHVVPIKKISLKNETSLNVNALIGENIYLYGSNNTQNTMAVANIINNCDVDRKIYINLSIAEKNKYLLNQISGAEMFVADIMEGMEKVRKIVNIAAERAKRLCENGNNVAVFIDDMLSIWSVDDASHMLAKKLISLTKNAGKKGSITTFAVMSNDAELKVFEKLADKRIQLN